MTTREEIVLLSDVPMMIDVKLDQRTMTIGEILRLDPGSVIKLGRSASDNIDILVGGALVASGEIVILEETMGVRITDFNEEH